LLPRKHEARKEEFFAAEPHRGRRDKKGTRQKGKEAAWLSGSFPVKSIIFFSSSH